MKFMGRKNGGERTEAKKADQYGTEEINIDINQPLVYRICSPDEIYDVFSTIQQQKRISLLRRISKVTKSLKVKTKLSQTLPVVKTIISMWISGPPTLIVTMATSGLMLYLRQVLLERILRYGQASLAVLGG
ncbi:hypothetical protein CEXT_250771 [Caerostris extrusa]|uniref:Uncharacterized protein n=1 Tax=Caerostris extrusa TaxID=172846 RepID=A0AAV4PP33_CAEEX|nr:hypothetical protein CEXT_250771 [Caerostris extrusa]